MHNSPRNHSIEKISGDASVIYQRGVDMENLGMQMRESALILEKIKNGTEGKGYSVEKIKDNVNSLHTDLGRAGELYEPSGRVVRTYGTALSSAQTVIDSIVENCETLWTAYQNALGNLTDATSATVPADETPEQKIARETANGELGSAKNAAWKAWHDEATLYDAPYETWDEAYENAVEGLKDANEDGVKDTFWDNQLPWIEIALNVLAVAGIVLAIAAVIIGGPLIAAFAAIVAIATLVLTIVKVSRGRGSGWDIAIAVVGVIPFGRLAQLKGVFKGTTKFSVFLKGFGADAIGLTGIQQFRAARGLPSLIDNTTLVNQAGRRSGNFVNRNVGALGDEIADLSSFFGKPSLNPSVLRNRLLGGGSADMAEGMANAFGGHKPTIVRQMDALLSGSALDGLQDALSGLDKGANVIDTLVKPGIEVQGLISGLMDSHSDSDSMGSWQRELASN
ncbi:MAG: hypothetical protein ACOH10_05950 [Rhodoglobus sp.]|uniref:hypothetical protein n=1 Tax=Salinibacterium sp. G-O1 TaxID=3046208 RepID=UPI0024B97045|nr:hypothetical protein [Salinibacterium sp. G-O1]MDJ0335775.1 hypothetical protein [Salinibacterium sp. G-O1]